MALTGKQASFAAEYLVDQNATQAAIRAGYSVQTANKIGSENLAKPAIATAIERGLEQMRENTGLKAEDIARDWKQAVEVDRNELMEVRRHACRYCWSHDHDYQMTPAEFRAAESAHAGLLKKTAEKDWARLPPPPVMGVPFDRRKDPHPDCPECFGDGEMFILVKDTRTLSPAARRLYQGVKMTKDGFELKIADPERARENLARHLGMFKDGGGLGPPGGGGDASGDVVFVGVDVSPDGAIRVGVKVNGG